ncbi:MAG TPA: hypothetical protein VGC01_04270 [Mucilaginibacter sp.]
MYQIVNNFFDAEVTLADLITMRKFISYASLICAFLAAVLFVYQAAPVFPYIRDEKIWINALAIFVFYYLAALANRKKSKLPGNYR